MDSEVKIRQCCDNDSKYIIGYDQNDIYLVCEEHSQHLPFQTGVIMIFDYKTKKELQATQVFA